ncbi:hypothetical protein B0T09DRAFT_326337 [Sordaria sp. MPI-SDFR-AT-0083]|nr:hypothetical protein B0T09DRAFT_326337 [Sordaria sp. MPI-SDFR-AT-0083]
MIEDLGRQPQMPCNDDDVDDGTVTTARAKGKALRREVRLALGGCRLASQAITLVEWLGIGGRGLSVGWSVAALVVAWRRRARTMARRECVSVFSGGQVSDVGDVGDVGREMPP